MQDYVGYRTKRRQSQKRKKRRAWRWLLLPAVLFLVFVILGAWVEVSPVDRAWDETADAFLWLGRKIKSAWPWKPNIRVDHASFLPQGRKTVNYLLVVTKQLEGATRVSALVLASYDSRDSSASLIYFPNDLMVNAPGIGMEPVVNLVELDEGRVTLCLVVVENILGVEIDKYLMCSDRDVRIVLNQMGDRYPVKVPSKLDWTDESLKVKVDLRPGEQDLSPSALASYLTQWEEGKVLELIRRIQGFAPEFRDRSRARFKNLKSYAAKDVDLLDTDATERELLGLWQAFAALPREKLKQAAVPVKEFRMETTVVHRLDSNKLPGFIKDKVKSTSGRKAGSRLRVVILNGCGLPGISKEIASRLDLTRLEIINTANADSFEYPETVISVHQNDKNALSAAEGIRNALEVGRVQTNPEIQDLSDITILVGKDYAGK